MKKVIHDVNPWNELYYNNCYYGALFPMLLHYGRSITPVLLQNSYSYSVKDDLSFKIERNEIKSQDQVLKDMGIVETMLPKDDVVATIKGCIDRGVLPMVFIDCFYETIRPDAFGKNHWSHILTVYGYNDETQTFELLEHSYFDSFTYKRAQFPYSDMETCCRHFGEDEEDFTGLLEFSVSEKPVDLIAYHRQAVMNYIDYMKRNRGRLFDGIGALRDVLEKRRSEGTAACFTKEDAEVFRRIEKFKKMERYAIKTVFFADESLTRLFDRVAGAWDIAAAAVENDFPADRYFDSILSRLIEAVDLEKTAFEKTYLLLERRSQEMNYSALDLKPYLNSIFIKTAYAPVEGLDEWRVSRDLADPATLPDDAIRNMEGVPVRMPSKDDSTPDNIMAEGQIITFEPGHYKRIYLLGIGEYREEMLLMNGDAVQGKADLFFHDAWTGIDIWEGGPQDKRIVGKIKGYGLSKSVQTFYLLKVDIDKNMEVDRIKLPNCPMMRIFAITLEK